MVTTTNRATVTTTNDNDNKSCNVNNVNDNKSHNNLVIFAVRFLSCVCLFFLLDEGCSGFLLLFRVLGFFKTDIKLQTTGHYR